MKTQLFIPEKIKVGYNKRNDTYTKKLAYIIYYDQKGVLRKETSWRNWITKSMGVDDFNNIPMEGFVLNKGVGGSRESYGWNARNEYIRVFDPRGFEFEISVANLLWILTECTSIKGRGLEGKFIYSWEGKELVLLPIDTKEYDDCVSFTKLQSGKLTKKNMVEGYTYLDSKQKNLVYLGHYKYYNHDSYNKEDLNKSSKKYIFGDATKKESDYGRIISLSSLNSIKQVSIESVDNNYADMLSEFLDKSNHSSPFKEVVYKNISISEFRKNSRYTMTMWKDNIKYYIYNKNDGKFEVRKINNDGSYWRNKNIQTEELELNEILSRYTFKYLTFENGTQIQTNN
jgi:hypothetical protein